MKCIRNIITGKITRVSNEQAERLVGNRLAVFAPKKAWKDEVRDAAQVPAA